jgi:hypothetical protein
MAPGPGTKEIFKLTLGDHSANFIVYYDQEEAVGDRGGKVKGFVSGDYEVWTSPTPEDLHSYKKVLGQHVSPGLPGGMQRQYAAELCVEAIMKHMRRLQE